MSSWQKRRDLKANKYADKFTPETRNEYWWMRNSDYKAGYNNGRQDLMAEVDEVLVKSLLLFNADGYPYAEEVNEALEQWQKIKGDW